ncbi:cell division protein FtsZ [SAR202 cluster bacterium AD-802-E10_MRT_200m]|nr:cell division protein FtsZ [SAR202 cluster bacterium AD-802-E10_MRT_200m]
MEQGRFWNGTVGEPKGAPVIKVVGVGGGGSNAVNRMFRTPIPGVDYISVNTDAQALQRADTPVRVQLGERLTRGLGVGGDPETGRLASEENREALAELFQGADMIFLAAGMGGGTGTGASPTVAEVAKESGALTVGVVTKPFSFEGSKRRKSADDGVHRLRERVDSLIVIPNDRLSAICGEEVTLSNAFQMADDVLNQGVQAIAELITVPGEINLDFADVKTVMSQAGPAWLGIGTGRGTNRAIEAARAAIACPLLEVSIDGSKGILFNITGGDNLTLNEVQAAADCIAQVVDPDANLFFGMVTDPQLDDEVKVTIIATGFPSSDAFITLREAELAQLVNIGSDNGGGEKDADIDLPPFLRKSPAARRRVSNQLNSF